MESQDLVERLNKELADADRLNGILIRKLDDIRELVGPEEGDLVIQIKAILEREG